MTGAITYLFSTLEYMRNKRAYVIHNANSGVVGYTFFLKLVTQAEIINAVNNTKSKKSKYHDDIGICLANKLITYLVIPLEHIFNISLQTGISPAVMSFLDINGI